MSDVTSPTQPPEHVYGFFAGPIDQQAVQRLANAITIGANNNIKHIHLMFQSSGGLIADGVCLYNLFQAAPMDISLYNVGSVSSAAVIAYLGADRRVTSPHGTFMIHKTHFSPIGAVAGRLQSAANAALLDDQRTEAILRAHIKLPEENWKQHEVADLWISAKDALAYGLATEEGVFDCPLGVQIFYVGPLG